MLLVFIPLTVSANDRIYTDPNGTEFHSRRIEVFDTDITLFINVEDPLADNYLEYFDEAEEIFESLHALTTNFDPASGKYSNNIYYINNNPNEWIEIDPMLYDILEYALEMVDFTDGYFNISMGHVIDAWKEIIRGSNPFYTNPVLTSEEIDQMIEDIENMTVVTGGILLDSETSSVKINEGVKIDLGALTKGYAVEMVYNYFESVGLKYFRINGSASSLKYNLHSPDRDHYIIGVSNPYAGFFDDDRVYKTVEVSQITLTTSGDTDQGFMYKDKIIHHIISPKTKKTENFYRLITIAHPDAAFSDVLTTAMFSMDKQALDNFIEKLNETEETKLRAYVIFGREDVIEDELDSIAVEITDEPSGDEIIGRTFESWLILSAIVAIVAIGVYLIVESGKKKKQEE